MVQAGKGGFCGGGESVTKSLFSIYRIRTGDGLDMNSPRILYIEDNPENRLLDPADSGG